MHELSIAMSVIDLAIEESDRRGGVGIHAIHLRWGPLSGVVKSALQSSFELAREETLLEETDLVFEDVPLVVFCESCQAQQELPTFQDFCCPACGTPCGEIVSGRELEIVAMEIEER